MKVIVCPDCGNRVDEDLWKCPCKEKKPVTTVAVKKDAKRK